MGGGVGERYICGGRRFGSRVVSTQRCGSSCRVGLPFRRLFALYFPMNVCIRSKFVYVRFHDGLILSVTGSEEHDELEREFSSPFHF
jgi:hypothetical protein